MTPAQMSKRIKELEKQMYQHAKNPSSRRRPGCDSSGSCRAGAWWHERRFCGSARACGMRACPGIVRDLLCRRVAQLVRAPP